MNNNDKSNNVNVASSDIIYDKDTIPHIPSMSDEHNLGALDGCVTIIGISRGVMAELIGGEADE